MVKRKIVFEITKLDASGRYVARSNDLRGVYAQGDTVEHLRSRLPRIIRAFYEAQGYQVETVRTRPAELMSSASGRAGLLRAEAQLEAA